MNIKDSLVKTNLEIFLLWYGTLTAIWRQMYLTLSFGNESKDLLQNFK
jgi:hypothetical protein